MSHHDEPVPPRRPIFITGLVTIFPLLVTVLVLALLWGLVQRISGPAGGLVTYIAALAGLQNLPEAAGTLAALALVTLFIAMVGLIVVSRTGARLAGRVDVLLARLPLVRFIYPHARTLSNFVFGARRMNFSYVVAVQYPRQGMYALGFATSAGLPVLSKLTGKRLVAIFIPTSPTPFTGWTVLFDEEEVVPLEMSVDEALRFIVSCGVITPEGRGVPPPPEALAQEHGAGTEEN